MDKLIDAIFSFVFMAIGKTIGWVLGSIILLIRILFGMAIKKATGGGKFYFPYETRFEHTHVVAGSGHGKTQLLQYMILEDLGALIEKNQGSIIVIDSQGDMINTILHLAAMGHLQEKIILVDPHDIEHPPALNLFDFGLDRAASYNALEREALYNSAVSLYEYLFGALLGAELTARQGMLFRYLARLMMVVPGATIHTFMGFIQNPEQPSPTTTSSTVRRGCFLRRSSPPGPLTRRASKFSHGSGSFSQTPH